ncbi:MAG: hypothetical protein AMJ75_08580 [Phycisphaerae bacterium SM1_79]|nr:MAG: hypothetical protein AMJ75_08580 [Phycisphaerae bacterium SM1_79]
MKAYQRRFIFIAAAATLVFALFGCKKGTPEQEQSDVADTAGSEQVRAGGLEDVLSLWESGDQESAAAGFLKINWQSPDLFSKTSILSLPEREFATLSASERSEVQGKAMALAGTIRQLVKEVLESARASIRAKDYDAAESQFNAVLDCGSALADSDGLAIMKMVGSSVQGAALKGLIELYTETKDQAKLKAAQEKLSEL